MNDIKISRVLFAAPASGSGKTVITCAVLELLRRRQLSVVSFKCGPDYIDPMFHRHALGVPSYNLDSFFLPPEQVRRLFVEKAARCASGGVAVIEGVMGYYDGVAGISTQASAYEIARITDTPVILIADGRKSSLSLAALIKGFLEYRPDSRIAGVILNRTSPVMANRLRPCLEELGIRFLGAVPEHEAARLESRHLGLTLPEEQDSLREKTGALADLLDQVLDIDGLLEIAGGANTLAWGGQDRTGKTDCGGTEHHCRRIAVARDEAFCFYYQENLDLLTAAGWEVVFFSPLKDAQLPEQIGALLLGGGYPECYAKELSENRQMLCAVAAAPKKGIRILAECGGFLYLHKSLEGTDGICYPMAGLIPADAFRTDRLSRFGYVALHADGGGEAFAKPEEEQGEVIRAHEFHYWDSTDPGTCMRAEKPLSDRGWPCMHRTDMMLAGFPHLYYRSNPAFILDFLGGAPT